MSDVSSLSQAADGAKGDGVQQEFGTRMMLLKQQQKKYRRLKILYDAVEDSVKDDLALDDELKSKIRDILLEGKLQKVCSIEVEGARLLGSHILGIKLSDNIALDYVESNKLKKILEVQLSDKYNNISKELKELDFIVGHDKANTSTDKLEDVYLLELRQDLFSKRQQYLQFLMQEKVILEDCLKLRLEEVPAAARNKATVSNLQSNINSLRARILEQKTCVDIILEDGDSSLQAYKKIVEDIEKQQIEYHQEISQLEKLKEKYEKASCPEYDEILKTYIQYKSSLDRKLLMYNNCLNKKE